MIPDWMPMDAWNGFVAMRKQIKKPLTPRAEKMAIAKLLDFKEQGQDIEKVLEQSEFNCWQDLYEVKAKPVARATSPAVLEVVPSRNWWMSNEGIIAKGKELDMKPHAHETYGMFKDRIFDALDGVNTRRAGA